MMVRHACQCTPNGGMQAHAQQHSWLLCGMLPGFLVLTMLPGMQAVAHDAEKCAGSTAACHAGSYLGCMVSSMFRGMQASALAAQPSAEMPAPARLVQIAVTAAERQPEVAHPLAELLAIQVSSSASAGASPAVWAECSCCAGEPVWNADVAVSVLARLSTLGGALGSMGLLIRVAAAAAGHSHPNRSSRKEGRPAVTPPRTLPQAVLDERGTVVAQQICAELSLHIRGHGCAPYAAAVRNMRVEQDGRVAQRVGAAAHLLALLLHSLADRDEDTPKVLGDPIVLSGAPPRVSAS